jgi:hypothetical protein
MKMHSRLIRIVVGLMGGFGATIVMAATDPGIHKVKDVIIYQDARFHSAFPSVVKQPDGELLVALGGRSQQPRGPQQLSRNGAVF